MELVRGVGTGVTKPIYLFRESRTKPGTAPAEGGIPLFPPLRF